MSNTTQAPHRRTYRDITVPPINGVPLPGEREPGKRVRFRVRRRRNRQRCHPFLWAERLRSGTGQTAEQRLCARTSAAVGDSQGRSPAVGLCRHRDEAGLCPRLSGCPRAAPASLRPGRCGGRHPGLGRVARSTAEEHFPLGVLLSGVDRWHDRAALGHLGPGALG